MGSLESSSTFGDPNFWEAPVDSTDPWAELADSGVSESSIADIEVSTPLAANDRLLGLLDTAHSAAEDVPAGDISITVEGWERPLQMPGIQLADPFVGFDARENQ